MEFFGGGFPLIENCLGWGHRMTPCNGQGKMLNIYLSESGLILWDVHLTVQ